MLLQRLVGKRVSISHTNKVQFIHRPRYREIAFIVCRIFGMSGLMRFSIAEARLIRQLSLAGEKSGEIATKINSHRTGVYLCTPSGIRKYIRRFKKPKDSRRYGRKRLDTDALAFMDKLIDEDREITSVDLQRRLLTELNITVSTSVMKKERRKLGCTFASTKYAQMVRVVNREKRLIFCNDIVSHGANLLTMSYSRTNVLFDAIVFCQNSSVE